MYKTLIIALVCAAGTLSATAALPKVNLKKPAVTADATGVKITKPAVEVQKAEGPTAADKIAEAKKNAEDAAAAAKQGVQDKVTAAQDAAAAKVNEVAGTAAAAKDGAEAKVGEAKAAVEAVKNAATAPSVEVTKPAATLDAEGLKVTKPAIQLKK